MLNSLHGSNQHMKEPDNMSNAPDFANNLFLLMEETFEAKHHGIFLDKGYLYPS